MHELYGHKKYMVYCTNCSTNIDYVCTIWTQKVHGLLHQLFNKYKLCMNYMDTESTWSTAPTVQQTKTTHELYGHRKYMLYCTNCSTDTNYA